MLVTVIHKPTAGREPVAREQVESWVTEAGHEVVYQSIEDPGWTAVLQVPSDVVVAAGGDGTVAEVFRALAVGTRAAILPLGTANNVAQTLGLAAGDPAAAVRAWTRSRVRRYDLPDVGRAPMTTRFVESVGGGVFAELIRVADAQPAADPRELLHEVIQQSPVARWDIQVDGQDFSGEFVAVEAMNIQAIGPNVLLAAGADPGDGFLDLVLVPRERRGDLAEHVRVGRRGDVPPSFAAVRGRRLRLAAPHGCPVHIDDQVQDAAADPFDAGRAIVSVDERFLQVLVPLHEQGPTPIDHAQPRAGQPARATGRA
jgi:diacylglycerol kinase (ATP)